MDEHYRALAKTEQAITDASQNTVITNNRNEYTTNNTVTNNRITNEVTRIDIKDGQQDDLIAQNTQTIINNKSEQAITDASQNTVITNNRNEYITNNTITNDRITTETGRLDGVDKDLQEQITTNNTTTNTKIDKVVGEQAVTDAAQNAIIADNKQNIETLDKQKADITYVDQQNKELSETLFVSMSSSSTTINNTINHNVEKQAAIDSTQNNRLDRNDKQISAMGYRMEQMDSNLSGGIASASAIAFMPTPNAGGRMMTGGAANYNGESAIAIGMTATTDSGKYTYRFGGTFSTNGGSVIGGGLGMAF